MEGGGRRDEAPRGEEGLGFPTGVASGLDSNCLQTTLGKTVRESMDHLDGACGQTPGGIIVHGGSSSGATKTTP